MASIPTRIKLNSFFDAVKSIAASKSLVCRPYKGRQGSQICFEFFKEGKTIPEKVVCYHQDLKSKVIYTGDLKKITDFFGMTKKDFEQYIKDNKL